MYILNSTLSSNGSRRRDLQCECTNRATSCGVHSRYPSHLCVYSLQLLSLRAVRLVTGLVSIPILSISDYTRASQGAGWVWYIYSSLCGRACAWLDGWLSLHGVTVATGRYWWLEWGKVTCSGDEGCDDWHIADQCPVAGLALFSYKRVQSAAHCPLYAWMIFVMCFLGWRNKAVQFTFPLLLTS